MKGLSLKFSVLNNLSKDLQKTDIWGNLVFTWPPHWMSKIEEKKIIFSNFYQILAHKCQANCQIIPNIYSLYKNTTIMEQQQKKL